MKDKIVEDLKREFDIRSCVGIDKYKTTLQDNNNDDFFAAPKRRTNGCSFIHTKTTKQMNYNTVPTILETPEQVSDLLITLTGIDIYKQTRKTEYVEHRALLCHILRNKLDMRWVSISDFIKSKGKSFDHATAIHANKMYPVYKRSNFDYYDKLESNFIVKSQIEYSQISKLEVIQKKYATLEKDYFKAIEKLNKFNGGYTKNEKQYRTLEEEQKTMYDERAALVLKSFEWKQNNSEYEIINCST